MFKKIFLVALIAIIVCHTHARRIRKPKRTKSDEESTPQPNVVTYSTFGFNDVNNYDGFVPSSPDYTNYLSNHDSSTRLYAPAFPTAQDVSGYNGQDGQAYNMAEDNVPQATLQYPQSTMNFYAQPGYESEVQSKNFASDQVQFAPSGRDTNNPIYGAKLSSRNRSKFNFTDYTMFNNNPPNSEGKNEGKYSTSFDIKTTHETKPQQSYGDPNKDFQNNYKFPPAFNDEMQSGTEHFKTENFKTAQNSMNFPKVLDFTKVKQYYPTDLENKFPTATMNPSNPYNSVQNSQSENSYGNNFDDVDIKLPTASPGFKNPFERDPEEEMDKENMQRTPNSNREYAQNYLNYQNKNPFKDSKANLEYKDKFKFNDPSWAFVNYTNDFKNWKNPVKSYQYSTNFSNMNFELDLSGGKTTVNNMNEENVMPKRPSKNMFDEVPASSNLIDLATYQYPGADYSSLKKVPGFKVDEFNNDFYETPKTQGYKYDPVEYVRNLYGVNTPKTTTQWGSVYKTSEYSPYKSRGKKPQFGEEFNDDVVHIPRRPYGSKYNFAKYQDVKSSDWASAYTKPYKPKKQHNDWLSDFSTTKFKSEEDLLGLRTHDTSDPAYLPTYRPFPNEVSSEYDYKKLVDKWRQSYMKAKINNAALYDYEGYATEQKPLHVPIPKPYPIEIPHPVIVPVPQPYPVRVPIPKPVAVPVIRELTVPVEKPMPYPVYKNVPYPVEKLVPVPVEKKVPVPVVKPYPVAVPHIRPVFHHSRPREEDPIDDDEGYLPRPETTKKVPFAKRPRGRSRTRARRPSYVAYSDRNRRRWPSASRRPEATSRRRPNTRAQPFRHHDEDDIDHDHTAYLVYCKRTGNC